MLLKRAQLKVKNEMDLITLCKVIGATIGSSIAVVFKPGGDSILKMIQRFVIGTILGFISAPFMIDYFGWSHTTDYWVAAATLGGRIGYMALQIILGEDTIKFIRSKMP